MTPLLTLAPRVAYRVKPPSLTIGVEEEYQIIDPATGELKSYITQILDEGRLVLKEQIKATQVGGKIYESRRSSQASRSSSKTRTATSSSAIAA